MKRIALLVLVCVVFASCANTIIQGEYITSDEKVVITFSGDTAFVDTADSGCGIGAYKFNKDENMYVLIPSEIDQYDKDSFQVKVLNDDSLEIWHSCTNKEIIRKKP
jgi:hypothetical protein